jgi:hypothetical protein
LAGGFFAFWSNAKREKGKEKLENRKEKREKEK